MEPGTGTLVLLATVALALAMVCIRRPHLGIGIAFLSFIPAPLFPTVDFGWLFYGFGGFTMLVLLGWLYKLSRRAAPFRRVAASEHIGSSIKAWLLVCVLGLPLSLLFNPGTLSDRLYFYVKALVPFLYLLTFFVVRALPFTVRQVQQVLNYLLAVALVLAVITFGIYALTGGRASSIYTPLAFPFTILGANVTFTRMLLAPRGKAMFAWGLLTAILALAMLLTFTKAQIITMAMSFAFIVFLLSRHRAQQTALRMIAFAAVIAIGATTLAGFASEETRGDLSLAEMVSVRLSDESSTDTRISEWRAALEQFAESPIIGKGIGHQLERDVMGESLTASYVHDQIAYTAMTTGLVGLIVYLMLVYNWARLVRRFRQVSADVAGPLAAVHGCVLTLGLYALMFATFGLIQHNLLLGVLLGLAVIMTPNQRPLAASPNRILTSIS